VVSLSRKVLVPTVLLGAVLAAGVAGVAWDAVRASHALERSTAAVRTTTALVYALADATQDEDRVVLSLAVRPDRVQELRLAEASAHVPELVREIDALPLAPRAAAIWRHFEETRASLDAVRADVVSSARRGDGRALALDLARWRLMTARSDALLKDFAGYHLRSLDRTVAGLQEGRERALRATVVAALLGLLAAAALAAAVSRAVVRPIVAVSRAAQRIADTGRLARVDGGGRDDEIGTLARSFDRMTERLFAANADLAELDRRKDDFLGVLSHELRNPLAPLRSSLFILDRADPGSDAAARAKAVMNRQLAHLTRLVDDLLDVTRIARGKIELRRAPVDLGELVRRCAEDHSAILHERGHEFRLHAPPPGALRVDGDETRLAQVLGNLLVNAAKFTPQGGRIALTTTARGGAAEIRVEDSGAGIDAQLLPHVFEPFMQGKQDLARSEGGLGLGLSLVKGIVELHGGTVAAHSRGPGLGSAFVVRLPLAAARPERSGAAGTERGAEPPGGGAGEGIPRAASGDPRG
jgi:signal transduction histidine kinase